MERNNQIEKILVSMTIERSLIDVGGTDLHESVENWLYSEYHYRFSDCLDHPESLQKVLKQRCDDKYDMVVNKIKIFLGEMSEREPFLEFTKRINLD